MRLSMKKKFEKSKFKNRKNCNWKAEKDTKNPNLLCTFITVFFVIIPWFPGIVWWNGNVTKMTKYIINTSIGKETKNVLEHRFFIEITKHHHQEDEEDRIFISRKIFNLYLFWIFVPFFWSKKINFKKIKAMKIRFPNINVLSLFIVVLATIKHQCKQHNWRGSGLFCRSECRLAYKIKTPKIKPQFPIIPFSYHPSSLLW